MDKFTSQSLVQLSEDINSALDQVAQKHGITSLTLGNIQYDDTEFTGKVKAVINNESHQKQKQNRLVDALKLYDLPLEFADHTFRDDKIGVVELVEYKSRNRKYPFIVKDQNGKRWKLSTMQMRRCKING